MLLRFLSPPFFRGTHQVTSFGKQTLFGQTQLPIGFRISGSMPLEEVQC